MFTINLPDIPTSPGVYLFLAGNDRIIYVGKAKSLRNRLASYFNAGAKSVKTEKMLTVAKSVRTIVTTNEVEAFLLESNLIKTEQPKYNVLLKDSKSYPYVKLTAEEYPRLILTRNTDDKSALYFGPFVNVWELRSMMEFLIDAFPLRTCTNQQLSRGKICLKYQIHKCPGPCEKLIPQTDYDAMVDDIRRFFKGDTDNIRKNLAVRMAKSAEEMRYEDAAFYRDRLNSIDRLFSKQQAIRLKDKRSLDLFYRHEINGTIGVTQLFLRNGWLIGAKSHFFSPEEDDLLERFISQFYSNVRQYPQIIVAEGGEISDGFTEGLSAMAGQKIIIGKKGYSDLIALARKNAEHATNDYLLKATSTQGLFDRLAEITGKNGISRVECIDISHLGGDNTVGVSVVSEDGHFRKKDYRKYKIKSAENNDVRAIKELLSRKLANVAEGSEPETDLYLIDGGVSQLNASVAVLKEYKSASACLSISKSRSLRHEKHDTPESIEEIHKFGRKNPLKFKRNDPVLLFLQKMRDEAHRFAITYSRGLSLKKRRVSPLLEIPGMGVKRAKAILMAIPDLYARENLTAEFIQKSAKIPLELAENVVKFIESLKNQNTR